MPRFRYRIDARGCGWGQVPACGHSTPADQSGAQHVDVGGCGNPTRRLWPQRKPSVWVCVCWCSLARVLLDDGGSWLTDV
jgi:hypothetical protein